MVIYKKYRYNGFIRRIKKTNYTKRKDKNMTEKKKSGSILDLPERETNEGITFPVSEEELCRRYRAVTTPMVNDVLRSMGLIYQTLPTNILPLREEMKMCGVVFTIKGSKNLALENEMEQRAAMLESICANTVCVWDTCGDDESAQWGEIMTMAAKKRGCLGAIIDGGVRDTDKVLEQKFPVFCRYRTSNGMLGRFRLIGYQIPIRIGDVTILPGDIVCADIDGCIIVPRKLAWQVLLEAEQIVENEIAIKKMVNDGATPTDVVKNGGYF